MRPAPPDGSRRSGLEIPVHEAFELPSPEMGGATGFHHDGRRRLCGQKRGEFTAGQTMVSGNVPGTIRDPNLENGFCQIDSDGRILHGGFLLLGFVKPHDHCVIASDQEESISSMQPTIGAQWFRCA